MPTNTSLNSFTASPISTPTISPTTPSTRKQELVRPPYSTPNHIPTPLRNLYTNQHSQPTNPFLSTQTLTRASNSPTSGASPYTAQ